MINFKEIKEESRAFLGKFKKYNISLWSLTVILTFIVGALQNQLEFASDINDAAVDMGEYVSSVSIPPGLIISLVLLMIASFITSNSASFVTLDAVRRGEPTGQPFKQQSEILSRKYFGGVVGINILIYIFMTLWVLLFALITGGILVLFGTYISASEGIIALLLTIISIAALVFLFNRYIAYSQATYIYKDFIDQGVKIKWRQAISESKYLTGNYRGNYFLFNLSFILWYLLTIVTLGIATFYVRPYIEIATKKYYMKLKELKAVNY